jgi:CSLREA domain-containing protein
MTTTKSYFRKPLALLVLAALGASMILLASQAQAASLMVTTEVDELNTDGDCSLREAIEAANTNAAVDACVSGSNTEPDTIDFAPSLSGQTITLNSVANGGLGSLPTITDTAGLTIDGGSADITISGNRAVRVFGVDLGILAMENLTVADGKAVSTDLASAAGAGLASNGMVTVTDSTFSGNTAEGTVGELGVTGGGIANSGTLTVTNSTFSGNSASTGRGGGISNRGVATVTNSTFSGNSAFRGGGIFDDENSTLTVTNSTFSGNSASTGRGAGIETISIATTLRNTIVADSTQGNNCLGLSTIIDGGYNLDDGTTCGFTDPTSQSNANPLLGPLQDNGGPTQTHALGADSPAIDKGNSSGSTTDQRGEPRPFDFDDVQFPDATGGDGSDIGAYELQGSTYDFSGFFSPVDNPPDINEVKAGRAIPVKFSLGGDQGLDIFESGYPTSQQIDCASTASVDPIEETVTAGSSSLSYDATTDTYTYVWKTDKAWADTCRELVVTLNDGSTHVANFQFVK